MTRVNIASEEILEVARAAKRAARQLAIVPREIKDRALYGIATQLIANADKILAANEEDQREARQLVTAGKMAQSLYDRLRLDRNKIMDMAAAVRAVAALPDPSGQLLARTQLDDNLELHKVSCPLGVLAIIFESRPDAVTQISALALKSGNAAILKGGREATYSTNALVRVIHTALAEFSDIPTYAISLLTDREQVNTLLSLNNYIDLVIPRGSNELVRYIQANTSIPVLGHAEGICHIYIDDAADIQMAIEIVYDSKLQYPAACNSVETLLIHRNAAARLLVPLLTRLTTAGVQIYACAETCALARQFPLQPASEEDWHTEYCAPILAIKIVASLDEAIDHINTYGSGHTDTIVTEDKQTAARFLDGVDSAGVYHNASTRFADGFRYGLGAEVGISTNKLHARGPVGLEGLVSYKYKLYGKGQVVASYTGANADTFKHKKLPID
ncbi:MAG: glutamate-5-semialdehyde dehydrogenase [Acidobacteriota bacterium]